MNPDDTLKHITQPFTRYEERGPKKWGDLIQFIADGQLTVVQSESVVLGPGRITTP
jgi:predicted SnoaL-like aldol condensation-catalyzing enzyme